MGVKWVYKTKLNENGEVDKYKARLVVKGYAQEYGVDYTEVFAPVAGMETVRLVVAFAAQRGWVVYQLDVKSAFLHGELNENVFVEQPNGYIQKGNEILLSTHMIAASRIKNQVSSLSPFSMLTNAINNISSWVST